MGGPRLRWASAARGTILALPVSQVDYSIGPGCQVTVVGNQHNAGASFRDCFNEADHALPSFVVQIACWLIAENKAKGSSTAPVPRQRAGAHHLTAWPASRLTVRQPNIGQHLTCVAIRSRPRGKPATCMADRRFQDWSGREVGGSPGRRTRCAQRGVANARAPASPPPCRQPVGMCPTWVGQASQEC